MATRRSPDARTGRPGIHEELLDAPRVPTAPYVTAMLD
jgi:hypothetical protein